MAGEVFTITDAPTAAGTNTEYPRPYEKCILETERITSPGPIPSTCFAWPLRDAWRLPCECITPFGVPVVPEVYSQNAMSLVQVATSRRRSGAPAMSGHGMAPVIDDGSAAAKEALAARIEHDRSGPAVADDAAKLGRRHRWRDR